MMRVVSNSNSRMGRTQREPLFSQAQGHLLKGGEQSLRERNKLQQKPILKTSQKREGMLQASSEEPLNKLWMIGATQDHTKPPLKLPQSLRIREIM
jgi:hypothetical protein